VSAEGPLQGLRVGILQARHGKEFTRLVEREGAGTIHAPCLVEVRNDDPDGVLRQQLTDLLAAPPALFVFQTGVGVRTLFELAASDGLAGRLEDAVRGSLVVARGPKPLAVLLGRGLPVHRRTEEPHTTEQVIELLDAEELDGRTVAIQHYGTANGALVDYVRERGALVVELVSYRWALPHDVARILDLLGELEGRRVDVTAFTSAAQVENLFAVAADAGMGRALRDWLNQRTVTAAIGPTCARALEEHGVQPRIQPRRPKMVPFVQAICGWARSRNHGPAPA
jgi:uroporphyrinogen-III synthase